MVRQKAMDGWKQASAASVREEEEFDPVQNVLEDLSRPPQEVRLNGRWSTLSLEVCRGL